MNIFPHIEYANFVRSVSVISPFAKYVGVVGSYLIYTCLFARAMWQTSSVLQTKNMIQSPFCCLTKKSYVIQFEIGSKKAFKDKNKLKMTVYL